MKQKNNTGDQGVDNTRTKNKGESQQTRQPGATSVSKKGTGKHKKDNSDGAEHNDTKKQQNSI